MGSYVIDVTVKELTVPNSPLIAKAYDAGKVIIEKSHGEVSLMEQNTIENVS